MRIEREKQERAEKHAQKAAGAKVEAAKTSANEPTDDPAMAAKKAAIAAAIERAKAQKTSLTPQNVSDPAPLVQAEIAEIDARREAAKQVVNEQASSQDEK